MTPTRQKIIDELAKVMTERSNMHGKAEAHFAAVASVWTWWLANRGMIKGGCFFSPEDAAVMCALAKIARMLSLEGLKNTDNFIDAAGYAICGAEIAIDRKAVNEIAKA